MNLADHHKQHVILNDHPLGKVNMSVEAQSPPIARTYVTGSNIAVESLKATAMFRWHVTMTKTAAGTASSVWDVAFGTTGTTADIARLSFTKIAGTAVTDDGLVVITAIVRSVGDTGVVVGSFNMTHNLAATGHSTLPTANLTAISSAFDTGLTTNIGLCLTGGTGDAITFQVVTAEAWNI